MIISSIVSEYNPFHNGHKYQIEQVRNKGCTHIVSIMSGNFTQRGTPAIVSKHLRAEMALRNGCDLIIEIPVAYSISSAEKFAFGSIFLANALGCIDYLSFGCENDNIELLQKAANITPLDKVMSVTRTYLKDGISFAKARYQAVEELYGNELANLLSKPNNILAIEYLKSLSLLNSTIKPLPILRHGAAHDSSSTVDNFASSTLLRDMLFNNNHEIKKYIPESSYEILKRSIDSGLAPAKILNCERAFLAKLRCMSPNDFLKTPDISEGLENKIYKAVKSSNSIEEIYLKVKSKRYTQLRIQRIILSSFLGIKKEILDLSPPYIKVLGFNKNGEEILNLAKNTAKIPIVTKVSDIKKCSNNSTAVNFFETESRAYDLYNLMLPKVNYCGKEAVSKIIKL